MAIDIKFDLSGNPEPSTIILANRNGNKLGQLKVNADSIDLNDKFNDASEISFTVNKYIDGELTPLWDKIVDFKLVYCKEWDTWFEIKVELDEETETVKTVFCTQLGQAELSQIMLYNIEINTEDDIARDDYKISILWDENDPKASILDRTLEKAPHYRIVHVDDTIKNIQRSFSFDGTSILDSHQEIAEEVGCLFKYPSNSGENGKILRDVYVYDLQQNCNDCGHRGEFTDKCPKCGSTNIKQGYGDDTLIFVTSDELASEGIQLVTDVDAVKNCFKLEGGDDLMTATIRNCNPNGTDYLWYFSDAVKEDMSKELVEKINSYDILYKDYYDNHESKLNEDLVNQYNALVEKYEGYYNTTSTCLNCDYEGIFENVCPKCNSKNILSGKNLQSIPTTITGYSSLMNAYYNTIDLALYLKSGLMPSIEMSGTTAEEQAGLLTASSLSPVAVNTKNAEAISLATANSAVLSMAKIIVKSTYKVEVKTSTLSEDKVWEGSFIITNYSDENDTAESQSIQVTVNNDTETFIKQKIDKALNKEDTDDYSISGLFEKDYDAFCAELKKYALNPLKSFYDACDGCLNILIDQGAGNKNESPDLYEKLYEPYYNKSSAIADEIKIREEEVSVIEGVWDKTDEDNPELITKGLQQLIEECRNEIQETLDFEKYLGEELWLEFCAYRREDTYSNDNYISDGLNNAKLFERALEFIEVAENEIYKSAELQHSISTSLNNLLAIDKFKPLVKSFKVGNWIRVQVDDKIFKLRLLEYEISFGSFDNISVEFSDVTKIKNGITDVKSVIEQASSMATNYSSIQRQADQGNKARNTINQWITDGLNTALVQVQSNDNEEVTMTKNGLLCRSFDDITGEYSPEQLRITHNIMAYTDNDWQTVKQAIGKHNYVAYSEADNKFIDKIGYGMNAEFVTAGIVSGSQIIGGDIYSDNYSKSDATGSYLNLRDGTFSFGGGALRFEGGELLISSPNVVTKNEVTEINESYLKTTTVYAENLQVGSANIVGQLTAKQINADGISAKDVNLTGIITANEGGNIGGWDIKNGYLGKYDPTVLSVDSVFISQEGQTGWVSAAPILNDIDTRYRVCLAYFTSNFAIDTSGILYANGAHISGEIVSDEGSVGGWNIKGDWIGIYNPDVQDPYSIFISQSGQTGYVNAAPNIDVDGKYRTCLAYFTGNCAIDTDGTLYANNAYISGNITATTGNFSDSVTIGGTTITAGALKDLYNYAVGGTGTAIKQIDAEDGSIAGWVINKSGLYSESHNTYIAPDGRFVFMPDDGDANNWCGFLPINSNTYNFTIGSSCRFQIGSTSLTEDDFKKLLALI